VLLERARETPGTHWTFVDNSEDSADAAFLGPLARGSANVKVVCRPDNAGFAGGCNLVGLATPAEWVILLNPDVWVTAEALDTVMRAIRAAGDEIDSLALSQQTGSLRHLGVATNRAGWFMDRPVGGDAASRSARGLVYRLVGGAGTLLGPSGGAAAYRVAAFRRFGGFYADLFAWGEDADLALRMSLAGSGCAPVDVRLPHAGGHSVSDGDVARRRARLLVRNRVWVAARLYTWPKIAVFTAFLLAVMLVKVPAMLRAGTAGANVRGVAEGYRGLAHARASYSGPRSHLLSGPGMTRSRR